MYKFIDLDTGLPAALNKIKTWVNTKLAAKQDALVSGTNIKTVNSTSLLGSGNISIPAGEDGKSAYQSYLDTTTDDPVKSEAQWIASLKGEKGDTGNVTVTDGVASISIINDLASTSTGDALSAKMGHSLLVLIKQIYDSLGNAAFWNEKPVIDWSTIGITMYNISRNLSSHAHGGTTEKVAGGTGYTENITFDSGYCALEITVMMGGIDVTASVVSGGTITIPEVTGAISITVTEQQSIPVTITATNCVVSSLNPQTSEVAPGGSISFALAAENGYELPSQVSYGNNQTASVVNGNVTIENITEAITVIVTASAITSFAEGGLNYVIDSAVSNVYVTVKSGSASSGSSANSGDKYTGNITIPATVTHDGATYNVTKVGARAFQNCASLTGIAFTGDIAIASSAFNASGLTSIDWGTGTVNLDNSSYAFYGLPITRIIMPDNVVLSTNSQAMFSNCKSLSYIRFGNGFSRTGMYDVDSGATGQIVDLAPTITYLSNYCFSAKTAKLVLRRTDGVIAYNTYCRLSSSGCTVYVPDALLSNYQAETSWNGFTIKGLSEYVEPSFS